MLSRTMGKLTVNFKCHHCGHCCTDVVCLPTPWDVIQIVKATKLRPLEFVEFILPDEISEVAKSDPTWLVVDGKRYMMALRRDAKKGCFFRDPKTSYCTVYEERPILCRLYPYCLHETRDGAFKSFTLHKDVGCPRHRDGVAATGPLYDLYLEDREHQHAYADLVKVFNNRKSKTKRPEDFIKMFIEDPAKPKRA